MGRRSRDAASRLPQRGDTTGGGPHGRRRRFPDPAGGRHLPPGRAGDHRRTHRPGPPGPALSACLMAPLRPPGNSILGEAREATGSPDESQPTVAAGPLVRQTALTDLARTALLGVQRRPLLEEAARLVQGALDAETCVIYEYLPGGHDLLLRAAASAPGPRRGLTAIDLPARPPATVGSDASVPLTALVVPIGASPSFGCVAVRAREHGGFAEEDRH